MNSKIKRKKEERQNGGNGGNGGMGNGTGNGMNGDMAPETGGGVTIPKGIPFSSVPSAEEGEGRFPGEKCLPKYKWDKKKEECIERIANQILRSLK